MLRVNKVKTIITAVVFILLETAAVIILHNNSDLQNTLVAKAGHAFMKNVLGISYSANEYLSLKKQNELLAKENLELRQELDFLKQQAESGNNTIPLQGDNRYSYTFAKIVTNSYNKQHNYFIINKGYNDGVEIGQGVVTGRGAIGIIEATSANFSYAISFLNYDMSLSARLGKSGPVGPLNWDWKHRNRAILHEIPLHLEINLKDTIYTSGFSSIFPPDIPLGIPISHEVKNGSTYSIEIELFEDFNRLRYVSVVKDKFKEEISELEGALNE